MLEIGPNLLLAVLFVCVVLAVMRVASMVEDVVRSKERENRYRCDSEGAREKEITEQVRIAHSHLKPVQRDCSCIKAT